MDEHQPNKCAAGSGIVDRRVCCGASRIRGVAAALAGRTKSYLVGQDIDVIEVRAVTKHQPALRYATAVVGLGGSVGLLFAFSFSQDLVDVLYRRFAAEVAIEPDQEPVFRDAVIAELANVVAGHCTADLAEHGERIPLSPPILLEHSETIDRMGDATRGTVEMITRHGSFDIHMVEPRKGFDIG
jgi:CheY-specific phosphatase CheX